MPSRRLVVALLVLALAGTACLRSGVTTEAGSRAVAEPALVDPPQPGVEPGAVEGATAVVPWDAPVDGQPVAWERATYRRADNAIDVFWWSGVEPCTVLERVDVEFTDDEVVVTVLEGAPPEAATISCIAMAVQKTTSVPLDEDLGTRRIVDGAAR